MTRKERVNSHSKRLVIVTGLSGSGMSSAINAFEDLGYFCVDNLPLAILSTFAKLLQPNSEESKTIEKAALVIDIRERQFLAELPSEVDKLRKKNLDPYIVFFEASDEVLQRRFSETRRPHPADLRKGLKAAIKAERKAMEPIRKIADLIIDTSDTTVHALRRSVHEQFDATSDRKPLRVQMISFGHKYGNPRDLDLMFDVRHLKNPYFEPKLRELTGNDAPVVKYISKQPEAVETIDRFASLLEYLIPHYGSEGKSYLTVGVGCTGGRHRSVMVANALHKRLKKSGINATAAHRDIQK